MRNLLLTLALTLTGCATVTPGTVVLEVPVCDGSAPKVLRQGRYWPVFSYCTDYYPIDSREQRQVWTNADGEGNKDIDESITFAGKDGQRLNVDVGIGFSIATKDEDIVMMTRTFGYDVAGTIHTRVRDSVRNALNMCASHMSVDDIYGVKKEELFACAEQKVQSEYNDRGLVITRLALNSEVRLPPQVQEAMEAATAATQHAQRVEREVAATEAEGKKTVAAARAQAEARLAGAEAEAESNRIISDSITPSLLKMKQMDIEMKKAEKWDGSLPKVSGGGDTSLILDMGSMSTDTTAAVSR